MTRTVTAEPPWVAHCIVGQARGFTQKAVWSSLRTNVIDAFGGGRTDCFLHLKADGPTDLDALRRPDSAWRMALQPTAVNIIRDGRGTDLRNTTRAALRPQCHRSGLETQFAIVSLDGLECLRLIEAEEARLGRKYDLVTKLRPDEQICEPWPSWRIADWKDGHYTRTVATFRRGERGVHDHVALMTRALADVYFGAFRLLNTFSSPTECVDDRASFASTCNYDPGSHDAVWPECLLTRWLTANSIGFDNGALLGWERVCLWRTPSKQARCNRCPATALPPRHRSGTAASEEWHAGYCAETEVSSGVIDCERASQGAMLTSEPRLGIKSRDDCVDFCFSRCSRCRYVSYSQRFHDCSWFASCNLSALHSTVEGNGPADFATRVVG
jgi:hypothetical protein